tara:strand:- start:37 stop:789 length:753 start_codon:yes stop_codon:yes gene_type:complete
MNILTQLGSEWSLALLINASLISIAQFFLPLLTPLGWINSGILGVILWGCLGWRGWIGVVIYFTLGSLVTRIGYKRKKSKGLEESRLRGGRRGPENVWGSAATGAAIAILVKLGIASQAILLLCFSASFTTKLADTFGSEIGQCYGKKSFLITSLRSVAPGTDGAISLEGTFASLFGAILMSISFFFIGFIPEANLIVLISIVAFLSTIIESYIGATVQKKLSWLSNELVNFFQTTIAALFTYILSINFI